jgi:diguanylate cyclase (GGDEF)-like protein
MKGRKYHLGEQMAKHIWEVLRRREVPGFPEELKTIPLAEDIHRELCEIRLTLESYAAWDLEPAPESGGVLSGYLKDLQSKLRHKEDELRREAERQQTTVHEMQEREYYFRYLASRDPLTGVLNRMSFSNRAVIELERVYAQERCACLAIMDLDYFKQFNDRHGHLAGDEALKHTVRTVSGALRKTDFMGRYGGEEFVIFFPNTTLRICHLVCERVLKTLASTPIKMEYGSVAITASIGLTQTGREGMTGEDPARPALGGEWIQTLIDQADHALYQAKLGGRNRTASYREERDGASVWEKA